MKCTFKIFEECAGENGGNKMKRAKGTKKENENESPCYPDGMTDELEKVHR